MPLPHLDAHPRLRGSRTILLVGAGLAVLGAWLNGFVIRYFAVDFQLMGSQPSRGDYLAAAGGAATLAVLIAAAALPLAILRAPVSLWVFGLAAAGTQVAVAIDAYSSSQEAGDDSTFSTWIDGVFAAFWVPLSWPLLLMLVVAAMGTLRGRSSRSPR